MHSQLPVQLGDIVATAAVDLTAQENAVAGLTISGKIALADGVTIHPLYLILQGAAADQSIDVRPLRADLPVKAVASGVITIGSRVTIDHSNPGQVKTVTGGQSFWIAEQSAAAGDRIALRYCPIYSA